MENQTQFTGTAKFLIDYNCYLTVEVTNKWNSFVAAKQNLFSPWVIVSHHKSYAAALKSASKHFQARVITFQHTATNDPIICVRQ